HGTMGTEQMEFSVFHIPGQHATAYAVVIHQEIECEILDKKGGVMLQALLVNRMQDRMPGTVGRGTGALRHVLAVIDGLPAKGTLINLALAGSRERHAIVLQLEHRRPGLTAHELDGILVAEPVGALDRV